MLDLFVRDDTIKRSTSIDSNIKYIRNRVNIELDNIKSYYWTAGGKVKNDHLLVRLIKGLMTDYRLPSIEYVLSIESNKEYIAKLLKITTSLTKGSIKESELLGENSMEIIISVNKFNGLINNYSETWKTLKPLSVFYTDITDMGFIRPDSNLGFYDNTLSIFTVDFTMLLVQYRYWALEQLALSKSTDPAVFIYQYVITNAIEDMVDIAFLNRVYLYKENDRITNGHTTHPFPVLNVDTRANRVIKNVVKTVSNLKTTYENILPNIPLLFKENILDQMYLLPLFTSRQSKWVTMIGAIYYIDMVFSLVNTNTIPLNRHFINSLSIQLEIADKNKILDEFSKHLYSTDYNFKYEYILGYIS